ncbi:hypothetical protein ACOSQ2_032795 [Xanthoceras sorbifolium]
MSAYAHQMEQEFSAQSLSSRGGSELGSQYVVESGFYMTSFSATIFIGGLITVGVLLITLVVALAVMLQSCQSKNAGVVQFVKSNDDYSYCKIFALHMELNGLEADEFPAICRDLAIQYFKEGQYARDINFTMELAESYFSTLVPLGDGLDVVLMDIDDIFITSSPKCTNILMDRIDRCWCPDCIQETKHLGHMLTLRLFMKLQANGWPVILFSRKHEEQRDVTTELLISVGYRGWSSLMMRLDDEMQMDTREYLSRRRTMMQRDGFRIIGLISSRMDALTGQSLAKRLFKIPKPVYYKFEHHTETRNISE